MIKHHIERHIDIADALESNIADGDAATVADQACDLLGFYSNLRFLFCDIAPDQRHTVVSQLESIIADCNARIKTLNQDTLAELQMGLDVPGYKLKAGTERRVWRDDAIITLKEHLEPADLYDMKLKGIPAVEKLLGKNGLKPAARTALLENIINVSTGTPSLVKEK